MKTVLITGAAQGIGLATARHYASQGWFVGLYDINGDAVQNLLDSGEFEHACGGHCDVTDYASLQAMYRQLADHSGGKLHLLVNNAGVLSAGRFEAIDSAAHDAIADVNVRGATNTLHAAFPLLRETPGATVVNLCSASSIHGIPHLAVYSASKFYIDGLTEALDLEWRDYDIRVTCVKPPVINTAMGQAVADEIPQKLGMDLNASDVAAWIQHAAEGSGTSYPMGLATRCWYLVDRLLPNPLRHLLTRYLTGA
ncbi:SDR family oxidoreductase [Pseudohalioglobus sediminis]|uniref:SDR family oxidoreductase n=1 Tax=Pseudohalioglobus sediminis TaxID=2606449 RepID=A0A5B0X3P5_9GAMM|nr:SDR family oxidoreductase [Pseudohalioglobus sediminis]KAA1193325.1 SDR family oxidoreductase [Pseudohalioglobus sediminis]